MPELSPNVAETVRLLCDESSACQLSDLPDQTGWYGIWVSPAGAQDIATAAKLSLPTRLIYVGECRQQTIRKHLAHRDIGQLTVMKSLAAVFRESWQLHGRRKGATLSEPGRERLREWMRTHLTATTAPLVDPAESKAILAVLDPPLRIEGWGGGSNELRSFLTAERVVLDRAR